MKRRDVLARLAGLPFAAGIASAEEVDSSAFDTVVVRLKNALSQEATARMERELLRTFPGKKILVVEDGAELIFK